MTEQKVAEHIAALRKMFPAMSEEQIAKVAEQLRALP